MCGVIRVKKSNCGFVTPQEMDRKRIPFIITRYKNQFILVGLKYKRVVTALDIVETKNIPLYKQAMAMQMGRPMQNNTNIDRCFVVKKDNYLEMERFLYYEEI